MSAEQGVGQGSCGGVSKGNVMGNEVRELTWGQTMRGLAERSSVMTEKTLLDSTINRPLMTAARAVLSNTMERSQIDAGVEKSVPREKGDTARMSSLSRCVSMKQRRKGRSLMALQG